MKYAFKVIVTDTEGRRCQYTISASTQAEAVQVAGEKFGFFKFNGNSRKWEDQNQIVVSTLLH